MLEGTGYLYLSQQDVRAGRIGASWFLKEIAVLYPREVLPPPPAALVVSARAAAVL